MTHMNTDCDETDTPSDQSGAGTAIEAPTPEEWRAAILSTVATD